MNFFYCIIKDGNYLKKNVCIVYVYIVNKYKLMYIKIIF